MSAAHASRGSSALQIASVTPDYLRRKAYWVRVFADARVLQWSNLSLLGAWACLPVVTAWIVFGVIRGHSSAAVYAVAGAVTASFGAFQNLGGGRLRSMTLLLVGIALTTAIGSLGRYAGWPVSVALATVAGFGFGAMTMLGYAGWWIGLQWMIGLLVYGAHPGDPPHAVRTGLAVLAGGATQVLFLSLIRPFTGSWIRPQGQPPLQARGRLAPAFVQNMHPSTAAGRYALRAAAAMLLTTVLEHLLSSPNGYWAPMTAAILIKPDFHEATLRAVNRLCGTLAGAVLVTAVIAAFRPPPPVLSLLLLGAIGACFALQRVNYALFTASITSYVVLLFSLMGLPEPVIAERRMFETLLGAAVALVVSLVPIDRDETHDGPPIRPGPRA